MSSVTGSFEAPPPRSDYAWMHSRPFVPLVLLAVTLAMFADVLFIPGNRVLSDLGMDTSNIFVYWRQFGFEQLRAGHLALRIPQVFSGLPFLGGFEEALLYPPNWILYLTLPLAKAINFEFALHVFLLGLFMAMWAEHYKLHPLAVLMAACAAMFSRSFFGGIFAGHLPHMDTMTWTPLILLSIDSLLDRPSAKWVLVGIFAVSMQMLAGYPPAFFDTVVTGAIFAAIGLFRAPRPLRTVLALSIVGVGATLICAAQLWTGLQATAEGTRHGGTSFAFTTFNSFSYNAFLTAVVPNFFGDGIKFPVWLGAGPNLFFGLTGLTMAILGTRAKSLHRSSWFGTMAVLMLIALGHHTPVFAFLYRFVPGFNLFRQPWRFGFELMLFMAMLSAFGMDAFIRSGAAAKAASWSLSIVALALLVFGAGTHAAASDFFNALWRDLAQVFAAFSEPTVMRPFDPAFLLRAEQFASVQCLIAAGVCLALAGLVFARATYPRTAYIVAIFGVAEAFAFAHTTLATFDLAATVPANVKQLVAAHPGDYRILNPGYDGSFGLPIANSSVPAGAYDISGYDPMLSRRYSEFIYYSQGFNPDHADMIAPVLPVTGVSPMWRILRLRYLVSDDKISSLYYFPNNRAIQISGTSSIPSDLGPLPHLLLVDDWRRVEHRDDIFAALAAPSFDAARTVILETDPDPAPSLGPPGTARLLTTTTDSLTITADLTRPELLLITDSYSRYWRAVALSGSSQREYHVMPADYTIIAIPLAPGHHLLRLEYAPSGWIIGRWISLASLLLYLAAIAWYLSPRSEN